MYAIIRKIITRYAFKKCTKTYNIHWSKNKKKKNKISRIKCILLIVGIRKLKISY
jgi:hypothetical protein